MSYPNSRKVYRLSSYFKVVILALAFLNTTLIFGQDPGFSQFYNTPLYLNPALSGTFQGSYRISTSYRDQWRAALGSSISTFSVGGDLNFKLNDKFDGGDIVGGGILFFGDRVGLLDYNTNQIAISGAYHKLLDKRTNQYLGIGVQAAMFQREVNYENINFQDQFNAIDGFTNPTGELLPVNNLGFGDLSIGINYSVNPQRNHQLNVGIALFHLLSPDVSFYNRDEILMNQLMIEDRLKRRLTVHGSYSFPYSEAMSFEPRALYSLQGESQNIMANFMFKIRNLELDNRGYYFGPGVKFSSNYEGQLRPEAVVLMVGYEYNGIIIGASYDHTVLDIVNGRNTFNSFEISFNYWGNYDNGLSICPKF